MIDEEILGLEPEAEADFEPVSGDDVYMSSADALILMDEHQFLETPFSQFTVVEGLLLFILLAFYVRAIVDIIKESFKWLR